MELKEEAEVRNRWKRQLSIEHKEEIHNYYKSMDLLISSVLNNGDDDDDNNNNYYY